MGSTGVGDADGWQAPDTDSAFHGAVDESLGTFSRACDDLTKVLIAARIKKKLSRIEQSKSQKKEYLSEDESNVHLLRTAV